MQWFSFTKVRLKLKPHGLPTFANWKLLCNNTQGTCYGTQKEPERRVYLDERTDMH